jgi:hypothetical protein
MKMNSKMYDIFIPAVGKDFNKLKFVVASIHKHLIGYKDIHLVIPNSHRWDDVYRDHLHGKIPIDLNLKFHYEDHIFKMDRSKIRHRPNWVYQQYLKLFQNVTDDLYLTIDSDVILTRDMPMFHEDKRILWMGWEQNSRPYFEFQEKMLNLPREYPHTFINDMNFIDRNLIDEMLKRNGYTVKSFMSKSYDVIEKDVCVPAEPEIWGQYAMKYHADKYVPMQCLTECIGKEITGNSVDHIAWTDEEIERLIEEKEKTNLHAIMIHSWWNQKAYDET